MWKKVRGEERKGGEADERQEPFEQRQREWKPAAERIERKFIKDVFLASAAWLWEAPPALLGWKCLVKQEKHRNHLIFCVDALKNMKLDAKVDSLQCWCKTVQMFSSAIFLFFFMTYNTHNSNVIILLSTGGIVFIITVTSHLIGV